MVGAYRFVFVLTAVVEEEDGTIKLQSVVAPTTDTTEEEVSELYVYQVHYTQMSNLINPADRVDIFLPHASQLGFFLNITRFIDTFQLYLDAVAQRAIDRDQQHIRSIEHYFELRRDTMGFKPAFAIIETKMNLPDEVMDHPTIVTIAAACGDMMAIANDLYSYNVE